MSSGLCLVLLPDVNCVWFCAVFSSSVPRGCFMALVIPDVTAVALQHAPEYRAGTAEILGRLHQTPVPSSLPVPRSGPFCCHLSENMNMQH